MTKKIHIMDTTLRDGEQTAGVAFTPEEKLTIAKALLLEAKVDSIEIASARVSKGEFEGAKRICAWAKSNNLLNKVEILGFIDGTVSIDWIHKTGCKVVNLLCKGSLNQLHKQLKKTRQEHLIDIQNSIKYAKSMGLSVNIYLEDASNGLQSSKDYVFYLLDNLKGVNRFMIADTLGIWNPSLTYKFCKELTTKYDYQFDFHAHNDYGLAVANSLAAIDAGVSGVHTSVNGLGERTGNCPLAPTIASIIDQTKYSTDVDETNLIALAKLVESISGIRLPPTSPIVGENVYTQVCGVHADGDKKGNLYCNKLTPERFGSIRTYALGKTSGKASIEKNLDALGIELDDESKKKVLKRIVELGDRKETITVSDLPYIVSDVLGETISDEVKLIDFFLELNSKSSPKASITLEIEGKTHQESATGDGQYDAFMKAIQKVYKKIGKKLPKLSDYTVRIPPGGKTDALVEAVITWNNGGTYKTKGVDSDQTTAAIKATMNMLNRLNSP